ncbi:hypothetical protein [Ochrobactrum sp. Marseille-Q0166]|uniref:hypothetical protein n=1 Tax=Ochrobactrum sp. Marseille-Q0166 TaxID=2761105 RepID=UPI001655E663|nr:hypothetical protein [Ochrobactrum sp. Marseille-Q0166]MBC8719174.1 hypothetical protein [Ochrobactrum sp. Marseille-Q0166]
MAAMNYHLVMSFVTTKDLSDWSVGREILSNVFNEPKLMPQRIATFGEVTGKHGIDVADLSECQKYWANIGTSTFNGVSNSFLLDFHWKRKSTIKSQGAVVFPHIIGNTRTASRISFDSQFRKDVDWLSLFQRWVEVTSPTTAVFHPFIGEDRPAKINKNLLEYSFKEDVLEEAWSRFLTGDVYTKFRAGELNSLVSGLTNLGWATYLGGEFAQEVDEKAILSAGFKVTKIEGGYMILVTEDLENIIGDYTRFSEERAKLKALFRSNLFLIDN